MCNGYMTFVISIFAIGGCTGVIGDVAGHLGCFINLKDGVNALAFVALGTSVPGTHFMFNLFKALLKSYEHCTGCEHSKCFFQDYFRALHFHAAQQPINLYIGPW